MAESPTNERRSLDLAGDKELQQRLSEMVRNYQSPHTTSEVDRLENRYEIKLSEPLSELNLGGARAYGVEDSLSGGVALYALVCPINVAPRMNAIEVLKPLSHPHLVNLVTTGLVTFSASGEERFVCIYERPTGKSLAHILSQVKGKLNEQFISERVITPLISVISALAEAGVTHGAIRIDNVYFGDILLLGPCITEPCGLSQPYYYEPPERLQAMPSGKGEGNASTDYYAMGILVLVLLYGTEHFTRYPPDVLIKRLFKFGPYNALAAFKEDISDTLHDLLRGVLALSPSDRWNIRYLKPWLEKKRYNMSTATTPQETSRPFEFCGEFALSKRELAHFFAGNFEKMAEPLRSGSLANWCWITLRSKELNEQFTRIGKSLVDLGPGKSISRSEHLMHVLMLLDPIGPARLGNLSFHLDGIDGLFAELLEKNEQADLQLLIKFIELSMFSNLTALLRTDTVDMLSPSQAAMVTRMEKLRTIIRNKGMAFGVERILYELSPFMPCQSPLLTNVYVTTGAHLLKQLDRQSARFALEHDPIDAHVAGFLGAKLNLQQDIRLDELQYSPKLSGDRAFIALKYLNKAQQKFARTPLPGLSKWIALRILPQLDSVNSKSIRKNLKKELLAVADTGDLNRMEELLLARNLLGGDFVSFQSARDAFTLNAQREHYFKVGAQISERSDVLGLGIARFIAYIALLSSIYSMVSGGY